MAGKFLALKVAWHSPPQLFFRRDERSKLSLKAFGVALRRERRNRESLSIDCRTAIGMHSNASKVRSRKIKPWPRCLFQLSDMFGGQPQIERPQIVFELLQCARADDCGRYGGPRVYPGKCHARRGSLQLPCNIIE